MENGTSARDQRMQRRRSTKTNNKSTIPKSKPKKKSKSNKTKEKNKTSLPNNELNHEHEVAEILASGLANKKFKWNHRKPDLSYTVKWLGGIDGAPQTAQAGAVLKHDFGHKCLLVGPGDADGTFNVRNLETKLLQEQSRRHFVTFEEKVTTKTPTTNAEVDYSGDEWGKEKLSKFRKSAFGGWKRIAGKTELFNKLAFEGEDCLYMQRSLTPNHTRDLRMTVVDAINNKFHTISTINHFTRNTCTNIIYETNFFLPS